MLTFELEKMIRTHEPAPVLCQQSAVDPARQLGSGQTAPCAFRTWRGSCYARRAETGKAPGMPFSTVRGRSARAACFDPSLKQRGVAACRCL